MNKEKGFTLVELLAVIVILAIILAIAVPSISNMIKSASQNALESDAKLILKALNYKKLENDAFDITSVNETNVQAQLGVSNSNYKTLKIELVGNEPKVTIIGKNKWNNFAAYGTRNSVQVVDSVTNNLGSLTGVPGITFVKTTLAYAAPSTTLTSLTITPIAEVQELTDVYVNGVLVPDNTSINVNLIVGVNTINIVVYERITNLPKTYVVSIPRTS